MRLMIGLVFSHKFQSRNGYSSINSAKSALSALLPVSNGVSLEDNILCQNFVEVYFNCSQVYHNMRLHGKLNNFSIITVV